jgi:hypothetical protein
VMFRLASSSRLMAVAHCNMLQHQHNTITSLANTTYPAIIIKVDGVGGLVGV